MMTIGVLARRAGVSVDTIRFYERIGLLPRAARTESGYRSFPEEAVARMRFVRSLRRLGLRLDEIARTQRALDTRGPGCEHGRPFVEAAIDRMDAQIEELRAKRRELALTLRYCRKGRCPLRIAGRGR